MAGLQHHVAQKEESLQHERCFPWAWVDALLPKQRYSLPHDQAIQSLDRQSR